MKKILIDTRKCENCKWWTALESMFNQGKCEVDNKDYWIVISKNYRCHKYEKKDRK